MSQPPASFDDQPPTPYHEALRQFANSHKYALRDILGGEELAPLERYHLLLALSAVESAQHFVALSCLHRPGSKGDSP